jgi:hypothetical protein
MTDTPEYDDRELVVLAQVADAVEASALESLLADRGIHVLVESQHTTPFDGAISPERGWARIMVYRDDLATAEEVLADFRDEQGRQGADLTVLREGDADRD